MSGGIQKKDRNDYLIGSARSMLDRQMPQDKILTTLEAENRNYCVPPLSRQELIYLIQNTQAEIDRGSKPREEKKAE